jgi:hypothetical protein
VLPSGWIADTKSARNCTNFRKSRSPCYTTALLNLDSHEPAFGAAQPGIGNFSGALGVATRGIVLMVTDLDQDVTGDME